MGRLSPRWAGLGARIAALGLMALALLAAAAVRAEMQPVEVAAGVYALIGSTDEVTPENRGVVGNSGFIVGDSGVILIGTGSSFAHGRELIALAEQEDVPLYFEAAVAGGIPIIKAVREALIGNHIQAIYGIINGTTNYILTRMSDAGLSYEDALGEAQALGYAESDPTLDVNGWDAGHKAIILAWLSYGDWVKPEQVYVEGVTHLTQTDLKFARSMGYAVKLLGVIRLDATNRIEVRVQPCLIPQTNIMANVHGVMNAVAVYGDIVGETLFYGSGAGQNATSSSVISDLADAVDNLTNEAGDNNGFVPQGHYGACLPVDETVSRYYLRLRVDDRPGVIASISKIIADHGIGILSLQQPEVDPGADADLMLMLHQATFGKMKQAVAAIAGLECVLAPPVLLRVESLKAREG